MKQIALIIAAIAAALALPAIVDAAGHAAFSALAIIPVMLGFWLLTRQHPRAIGFTLGNLSAWSWAFAHPLFSLGIIALVAGGMGEITLGEFDMTATLGLIGIIFLSNMILSMLTEEGFFRGWLWAMMSDLPAMARLALTTLPFAALHLSFAALEHDYQLPPVQLGIYLVGALTLGAIWGMMREISGSIILTSFAHGLWNGLVYPLFGIGTRQGDLGITRIELLGPERGWLGLALNIVFAVILWRAYRRHLVKEAVQGAA